MLRDILIEPFETGDWFIGLCFWGVFLLGVFMALVFFIWIYTEIEWSNTRSFEHEGILISTNYSPSTLQTSPVVTSDGKNVSVGTVTSGHSEEYLTVWDLGEHGRAICKEESVFRFAKPKSTLIVKILHDQIRIVGINP